MLVMIGLCCHSLFMSQYAVYITLTGIALIGMVLGYAIIVAAQYETTARRTPRTKRIRRNIIKTTRKSKATAYRNKSDRKVSEEHEPPVEPS